MIKGKVHREYNHELWEGETFGRHLSDGGEHRIRGLV